MDYASASAEVASAQIDSTNILQHLESGGVEVFENFFIPEELVFKVPDFHDHCWKLLTSTAITLVSLAIPRGHAKTTLAKLAVVWHFLFTKVRFCVYVSNTAIIAQNACRDIIAYIETDNFRTLFGEVEFEKKSEGHGFYIFILNIPIKNEKGEIGIVIKRCILKSLGAGQQVRGLNVDNQRPDLAVVDDLEDNDNTATPFLQNKLIIWFYGPFRKALDRKWHKIIFIGNLLSNTCLIKKLVEDEEWHSIRLGALLSDGTTLWPDLWPLDQLIKDFKEYARRGMLSQWFAEMQNMPVPAGLGLITTEEIVYRGGFTPADIEAGFIVIDPAISQRRDADNSCIGVHILVDGIPHVQEYELGKSEPLLMFEIAIAYCNKWGINVIGIENTAFQAVLQYFFEYLLTVRGLDNIQVVPLFADTKKSERARAFASLCKAGEYTIPDGDVYLTEQLLLFNPGKKDNDDDALDMAAYGPQMIDLYWDVIVKRSPLFIASPDQGIVTEYKMGV